MDDWLFDAILVPFNVLLLLAYHLNLYFKYRQSPLKTLQGINHKLRYLWIQNVMGHSSKDILAVQTFRNSLMVCSLLASTAIILSTGLSAFALSDEKISVVSDMIIGDHTKRLLMLKLLLLILLFQGSFFCFMQSMRFLNHVNYLINATKGEQIMFGPMLISKVLERAMNYHTLGIRFYYLAFPCLVWIFGPIPMTVVSVTLVIWLFSLDSSFADIKGDEELALESIDIPVV